MVKYSLVLLATAAIIFSSGCDDSECCGGEKTEPVATLSSNVAPVARIKSAGATRTDLRDCTAGVFDFDGLDSTDKEDGSFNTTDKYIWTVGGQTATADANGNLKAVTCPPTGQTKQVCVKVVDSDNQESANMACMTLGKSATPPPVSNLRNPIIALNATSTGGDGYDLGCTNVKDQDSVNTDGIVNPYGTDSAIKDISWTVLYADGSGHTISQSQYNQDFTKAAGFCGKWVDATKGNITITATPTDDEDATQAYTFVLDVASGAVTAQ